MRKLSSIILVGILASLAGCQDPNASGNESLSCLEKLNSDELISWITRAKRIERNGRVTLTVEVEFPFNDAKMIENSLAVVAGNRQNTEFNEDGSVRVQISGISIVESVTASASLETIEGIEGGIYDDGLSFEVPKKICGVLTKSNGRLNSISVQTENIKFDDGRLHSTPIP